MFFLVAPNCHFYPLGQRVNNRNTYTVQSSRNLVPTTAKFTAGVEYSHYCFYSRFASLGNDAGGNTPAVVCHGNRTVGVDVNLDVSAVASQRLINGIVHNLVN